MVLTNKAHHITPAFSELLIYALRKFAEDFPDVQTTNIAAMLEDIRDNLQ